MSRKPIVVAGGILLLACGIALARQNPPPLGPPSVGALVNSPLSGGVTPPPSIVPEAAPVVPGPPAAPKKAEEQTLDQLLDALEQIRTQKSELEKKEQELTKVIQKKAAQQKDRMDKLGVNVNLLPLLPVVPLGAGVNGSR